MEDTIQVIYNHNFFIIQLGDKGVELTREEAEKLFVDLGHAMQDQDERNKESDAQ